MSHTVGASIAGRCLVRGSARGKLLVSETELSFWGGVDPASGDVIDQHHPLSGENVAGKVVAIPGGRGSCSGSGALLELILNGCAPAGLLFCEPEEILTLGVIVADILFGHSLPVLHIDTTSFASLQSGEVAEVDGDLLRLPERSPDLLRGAAMLHQGSHNANPAEELFLEESDKALLNGEQGHAAQVAMQIIVRMAMIQGATELIDVTQAHIDACVYNGQSSLLFAERLLERGARVRVPTTLNSLSVDKRHWRQQGVEPALGIPASQLGDSYIKMGAQESFTCAPYLLDTAPLAGENIVWAESNAVMFANSIIGARTRKYPDFMDACIALTARAPATGCHLDAGRRPEVSIHVAAMTNTDDAFWPLLGYHTGSLAGNNVPIIYGLESLSPNLDDLKAFSAAFATTSSTPMFHIAGITPEAKEADVQWRSQAGTDAALTVSVADLQESWQQLNSADESRIDLVSLGNPHFSFNECAQLASLCSDRQKNANVQVLVTLGRAVFSEAEAAGYVKRLQQFGIRFITDTCWCMIGAPIIPDSARTLMTNSAKYAHYGPGMVGRKFHFGSLAECVDAACSGSRVRTGVRIMSKP